MSGKYALIIGNMEYTDPGLSHLSAPNRDADNFARILKDQSICAFDDVKVLLDQPEYTVRGAIDEFFDQKRSDDLLILYFSGHGVRDEFGSLYLALKNTSRTRLRSTAIKSDYIREAMDQSRSKRQVLILDCCNSGAFVQGTKAATGISIGTASAFDTGYGRVVLTASDATQFAWEGDQVIGETENSLFTHFLVDGLKGVADRNGDGQITVDELYDYAYEQVKLATPKQTPSKFSTKQQGEIVLRRNIPIESTTPVSLPDDLLDEIEDTRPYVREAAVKKLERILKGRNIRSALLAHAELERIVSDENTTIRVAQEAKEILNAFHTAKATPVKEYSTGQRDADKPDINKETQPSEGGQIASRDHKPRPAPTPKNTNKATLFMVTTLCGFIVILFCCSVSKFLLGLGAPTQFNSTPISMSSTIARSTDMALLGLSSTESVRSTNVAMVEKTGTAIAQSTNRAEADTQVLETAMAVSTVNARKEYISALNEKAHFVYGPETGSLQHNRDSFIKIDDTGVDLRDFVVTATFQNPYSATSGAWDYGFLFRKQDTTHGFRIIVASDKEWMLLLKNGASESLPIQKGRLSDFNIDKGNSNTVMLYCDGGRGTLYVNGYFVADLDLSANMNSGAIEIGTGFFENDEITGNSTNYQEFKIWEIP